jgi:hypothetical protein
MYRIIKFFKLFIITVFFSIFFFLLIKSFLDENINILYYLKYYFLIFIIIIILFFSGFIGKENEINLIICFTSITISLFLIEFILLVITASSGTSFDTREKLEVIYDEKKNNKKITLSIPPSAHHNKKIDIFPLSGISNSETILCNEIGKWVTYNSDRYGFNNNDKNWNDAKIENLLIGDSFVHGHCVDYKNTFNGNFEKNIKDSVLNLSYAGTGPLIQLGMFKEYVSQKKIKNLTLFYYEENDLIDLDNELNSKILSQYLKNNQLQNLSSKQSAIDSYLINIIKKKDQTYNHFRHKLSKFIKLYHVRNIFASFLKKQNIKKEINFKKFQNLENEKNILISYEKILKQFIKICNDKNIDFRIVYLPSYARYSQIDKNTDLFLKKKIINIFKKNNIKFIDIDEKIFKKSNKPKNFFQNASDNHYTVEGYKLITEMLINEIYN